MEIKYRADLPKLMKYLGLPMIAAEIGCAEGLFSRDLLTEGMERLYSIDNWHHIYGQSGDGGESEDWHTANYRNAFTLLMPFGDKSRILRGFSYEMAKEIPDNTLGLAYIDCDHSFAGVLSDIVNYYPKLVIGGIMAFHDFEMPEYGVKKAVTEFAQYNNLEIHLLPENAVKDAGAYFVKK